MKTIFRLCCGLAVVASEYIIFMINSTYMPIETEIIILLRYMLFISCVCFATKRQLAYLCWLWLAIVGLAFCKKALLKNAHGNGNMG